jgi:hypothetical protein
MEEVACCGEDADQCDVANGASSGSRTIEHCCPAPTHRRQSTIQTLGLWDAESDSILRNAVERYGDARKQWSRIAAQLHGKTSIQCRVRYNDILKDSQRKKGSWTPGEDAIIRAWVAQHGESGWGGAAIQLIGRTAKGVRERYMHQLLDTISRVGWSSEEDSRILQLQRELGPRWTQIAAQLPGRTRNSVKNRWKGLAKKQSRLVEVGTVKALPEAEPVERPAFQMHDFQLDELWWDSAPESENE